MIYYRLLFTVLLVLFSLPSYASRGPIFVDNFDDGDTEGWTVVDEGADTSQWDVSNGEYVQLTNIYSLDASWSGTYAYTGGAWKDYTLNVRMKSSDDDGIGVMFHFQDSDNYYRFVWQTDTHLHGRRVREIAKKRHGRWSVLATESVGYSTNTWYSVMIMLTGTNIKLYIDEGGAYFGV